MDMIDLCTERQIDKYEPVLLPVGDEVLSTKTE